MRAMRFMRVRIVLTILALWGAAAIAEVPLAQADVARTKQTLSSQAQTLDGQQLSRSDLRGNVQRCSGAIDATGTEGAGIGRLIDLGRGYYNLVLQLNLIFLSQFSPELTSFGYSVTYNVNGHEAKGLFAGDLKFRPGNQLIHSKQQIQGRRYTRVDNNKKFVISSGDTFQLNIVDYLVDPVAGRAFPVHGRITCEV